MTHPGSGFAEPRHPSKRSPRARAPPSGTWKAGLGPEGDRPPPEPSGQPINRLLQRSGIARVRPHQISMLTMTLDPNSTDELKDQRHAHQNPARRSVEQRSQDVVRLDQEDHEPDKNGESCQDISGHPALGGIDPKLAAEVEPCFGWSQPGSRGSRPGFHRLPAEPEPRWRRSEHPPCWSDPPSR